MNPRVSPRVRNIFALIMLGFVSGFVLLVGGDTTRFADPSDRHTLLVGMVVFGFLYYFLENTAWKLGIGIVEIVVALVGNNYQLQRIANPATRDSMYDRLAFLVGGIIVLSKGVKDVIEGLQKLPKKEVQK